MKRAVVPLVKLSVFATITVLATAMLGVLVANSDFRDSVGYAARFTDATSLVAGDDVRIAGVRVGQVESVELTDRHLARVAFTVDARRTVYADTILTLKYRNMLGQRYLAVERRAGKTAGRQDPGSEIPLERTKPAVDLSVLFNGFRPLFKALSPKDVNALSYELVQVFQGEGGTVDSLLRHTASLASAIAGKDKVIGQVIDNLSRVVDTLARHGTELSDLLDTVQRFVSGLAGDRTAIGDAIGGLSALAGATAGLLDEGRPAAKEDIEQLGRLSKNLADSQPMIDAALRNLPVKMSAVTRIASYGAWFNLFLCEAKDRPGGAGAGTPPGLSFDIPVTEQRCRR